MFLKKYLILLFLLPAISFAQTMDTCPTVQEIKNNNFKNFKVYDIENGGLVDADQLSNFKAQVKLFALAEWMADAPEGEAHCYYGKEEHDQEYLGVFLASKSTTGVDLYSGVWIDMSGWTWQCNKSAELCRFVINTI